MLLLFNKNLKNSQISKFDFEKVEERAKKTRIFWRPENLQFKSLYIHFKCFIHDNSKIICEVYCVK